MNIHDRWSWETRKLLRDRERVCWQRKKLLKSFPCPSSASSRKFDDITLSPTVVVSFVPFLQWPFLPSFISAISNPSACHGPRIGFELGLKSATIRLGLIEVVSLHILTAPTTAHTLVGNSNRSIETPSSWSSIVMVCSVSFDGMNCAAGFSSAKYSRRYDSIEYQLSYLAVLSASALGRELLLLTDRMMSWMLSTMRFSSLAINT